MSNPEDASNGGMFGKGDPNDAYAQYFVGDSFTKMLGVGDIAVVNVTFEPACRNNWHVHHGAQQTLVCHAGRGWYQEWGKPAQELKAGDVVVIPLDVKHWHGAAKDSWFSHLSIQPIKDGASTEWLEPVDAADYDALA